MTNDFEIQLVIARFNEDLRWVRRVPSSIRVTVYNKGDDSKTAALQEALAGRVGVEVVALPNVGREAHSYLTHLSHHYQSLAGVTVFCQGHPFDHAPEMHRHLKSLADHSNKETRQRPDHFLWFGFLDETDDQYGRRLFVPWNKNPEGKELLTGTLHRHLFRKNGPEFFHFRGGAQFAVTREAVHRRPQAFYKRGLRLSTAIPLAAHSYERLWDRLFGDPVIDPSTLGPDGVRYLKRIRRLEERSR